MKAVFGCTCDLKCPQQILSFDFIRKYRKIIRKWICFQTISKIQQKLEGDSSFTVEARAHTMTSTQKYPVHTSQRVTGQSKLISFTEQLISLDEEQNYLTFFFLKPDIFLRNRYFIRNRYLNMTECKQALDFTNRYMFTLQSASGLIIVHMKF